VLGCSEHQISDCSAGLLGCFFLVRCLELALRLLLVFCVCVVLLCCCV